MTVTAIYLIPEDQATPCSRPLFGDQGQSSGSGLEKLAHAMDAIRDKYGKRAIGLASAPGGPGAPRPAAGGNREG